MCEIKTVSLMYLRAKIKGGSPLARTTPLPTSLLTRGMVPARGAWRRGAWRRSRPLSPEWPAAAPVLAVSETCAWVSEVEARR